MTWASSDGAEVFFLTEHAHASPNTQRFLLRMAHNMYLDGYRTAILNLGEVAPRPDWLVPPLGSHEDLGSVNQLLDLAGRCIVIATTPRTAYHAIAGSLHAEKTGAASRTVYFLVDGIEGEMFRHLLVARLLCGLLCSPRVFTRSSPLAGVIEAGVGCRPAVGPTPLETAYFERHGQRSDGNTVLYFTDPSFSPGRLVADAFQELTKTLPEASFKSMGFTREGLLPADLATHVELGWLDDNTLTRREALTQAGCFVTAVPNEVVPEHALRAMAVGCPVVAIARASRPSELVDGENCLLVEPGDAKDLARAIERVMTDAPLREHLVASGREHVSGNTWRNFLDSLPAEIMAERREGAVGLDPIEWK
jgi:glycosyltransferase involved in cell wall biosynthesis